MVQVFSKLYIKDGKTNEFTNVFNEMIDPTLNEDGCLQFEILKVDEDESQLFVLEKWATDEGFSNHINTEHFERVVPRLEKLMARDADVNICRLVH